MLKRIAIPDSHGNYIDKQAAQACVRDIKKICPDEIVFLGDQVDASGLFSKFKAQYIREMSYTYKADLHHAKNFFEQVRAAAPKADIYALEGNHEWHVERWIASTFDPSEAVEAYKAFGPDVRLGLKDMGVKYVRRSEISKGTTSRGILKLSGCYFVHGISQSLWATGKHLDVFGANVCHGHTHRAISIVKRRPTGEIIGGYCPGTLAQLSPLYMHTTPDNWTHGYGLQFVDRGNLFHYNVPIIGGRTVLP
jgi:hypothetical protein